MSPIPTMVLGISGGRSRSQRLWGSEGMHIGGCCGISSHLFWKAALPPKPDHNPSPCCHYSPETLTTSSSVPCHPTSPRIWKKATYLLSGNSRTVWKRVPMGGTISGRLFSLLSFLAGWLVARLRAWASSRLTNFMGRERAGRVRLFMIGRFSVKRREELIDLLGVDLFTSSSQMPAATALPFLTSWQGLLLGMVGSAAKTTYRNVIAILASPARGHTEASEGNLHSCTFQRQTIHSFTQQHIEHLLCARVTAEGICPWVLPSPSVRWECVFSHRGGLTQLGWGRDYPFSWQPTPVLLPRKSHGQRSLVGSSPWGHEESDMTEQLPFHFKLSCIGEGNGSPLQCSCLENPRDWGAWLGCHLWGRTESAEAT